MSLFTTMMDSVGTLKRPAITRDSHSGTVQTFGTILDGIPCSVQPASGSVVSVYFQRNINVSSQIYVTSDIGAITNDIFEAADSSDQKRTFHVEGMEREPYNRRLSPYWIACREIK